MPDEKLRDRVRVGVIFDFLPVSKQLLRALEDQGLDFAHAAWWILRSSIVLGGGEARYNGYRDRLAVCVKEGGR